MARAKRHFIPGYIWHITHRCHKQEFLLKFSKDRYRYLGDGAKNRQDEWTGSIAVGSRSFIENVKTLLGFKAKGKSVLEGNDGYQLWEESAHYKALFGVKKDDIGLENTYLGDLKSE